MVIEDGADEGEALLHEGGSERHHKHHLHGQELYRHRDETTGNKVSWKMKCTGENPGTFTGETTYKGDSYDSTMKMVTEGQTMNMKISGKRIGNCP